MVAEGVGLRVRKGVGVMVGVYDGRGVMVKARVRVSVGVGVRVTVGVGVRVGDGVMAWGSGVGVPRQPTRAKITRMVNVKRGVFDKLGNMRVDDVLKTNQPGRVTAAAAYPTTEELSPVDEADVS